MTPQHLALGAVVLGCAILGGLWSISSAIDGLTDQLRKLRMDMKDSRP